MRRVESMEWERAAWVADYQGGERISDIAERYQVSRKTVYKWIARHELYGEEGLRELSRAPHEHPQAVSPLWRERIRAARLGHRRWGARKLAWWLEQHQHDGEARVPSASTIGRVLSEMGLIEKRRRSPRARGTGELHPAQQANQVWAIDFKGWRRTQDGTRCEPLTVTDQATRYLLCCQGLESTRTELVQPVLERVFRHYGLPERMRSDNGSPFASVGGCGLSQLAVWWIELGIECERIDPGHPQQNGRHERMHRTLQEGAMEQPAATLRVLQKRLDQFRQEYNQQRPHEALGQRVPASLYQRAEREYPRRIEEPHYAPQARVRRVESGGRINLEGRRTFLSHALEGKWVGLEPEQEGAWRVLFYKQWLGVWEPQRDRLWRPWQWRREQDRRARPVPLRPDDGGVQPAAAGVKAQDELAALGLDDVRGRLSDP